MGAHTARTGIKNIYIFILKSISEFKVFLFYSITEVGRKSVVWTNYFPDQKRISPTSNITPIDIFCGQKIRAAMIKVVYTHSPTLQ